MAKRQRKANTFPQILMGITFLETELRYIERQIAHMKQAGWNKSNVHKTDYRAAIQYRRSLINCLKYIQEGLDNLNG